MTIPLESLPWVELPASLRVDYLQLLSHARPVIRSRIADPNHRDTLRLWSLDSGFECEVDGPWICMSAASGLSRKTLDIDANPEPHEYELGRILGYPECCCRMAAEEGEANLDAAGVRQLQWHFSKQFRCIDSSGYRHGRSLISHLACRPSCEPSRELALAGVRYSHSNRGRSEPCATWAQSVSLLCGDLG